MPSASRAKDDDVARAEALASLLTSYVDDGHAFDENDAPEELKSTIASMRATLGTDALDVLRAASRGALRGNGNTPSDGFQDARAMTIALTPMFVAKTRDKRAMKVFVNVCAAKGVGVPMRGAEAWLANQIPKDCLRALETYANDNVSAMECAASELRFPMSCSHARLEVGTNSETRAVFDVAVEDVVARLAATCEPLKRFLVELALGHVAEKHDCALEAEYRLLKKTYVGSRLPENHVIRVVAPTKSVEPLASASASAMNEKRANEKKRLSYDVEFVNHPLTAVKVVARVPAPLDPRRDVVVCVVREGVTIDAKGYESERVEFPFLVDAKSARLTVTDASTLTITVDYLPYDVAVERARAEESTAR